jgi:hypothetical protein
LISSPCNSFTGVEDDEPHPPVDAVGGGLFIPVIRRMLSSLGLGLLNSAFLSAAVTVFPLDAGRLGKALVLSGRGLEALGAEG